MHTGMKKIAFLDFDHTLFNTDEFFHVDVRNAFLGFGISVGLWEEAYFEVLKTAYTLDKHVEGVSRRSGKSMDIDGMKEILTNRFSDLRKYLFSDAIRFLNEMKGLGFSMNLLSFGNESWQSYKIIASGIRHYFDQEFFTAEEGLKANVVVGRSANHDRILMIDNNPAELDLVKDSLRRVETWCIDRVPESFVRPVDELSRLKYLDARKYVGMNCRHNHNPCENLDSIIYYEKNNSRSANQN